MSDDKMQLKRISFARYPRLGTRKYKSSVSRPWREGDSLEATVEPRGYVTAFRRSARHGQVPLWVGKVSSWPRRPVARACRIERLLSASTVN